MKQSPPASESVISLNYRTPSRTGLQREKNVWAMIEELGL